jgi:hypothetical protein
MGLQIAKVKKAKNTPFLKHVAKYSRKISFNNFDHLLFSFKILKQNIKEDFFLLSTCEIWKILQIFTFWGFYALKI